MPRQKNKRCQVCGKPSTGKQCRDCYLSTPLENKRKIRDSFNNSIHIYVNVDEYLKDSEN